MLLTRLFHAQSIFRNIYPQGGFDYISGIFQEDQENNKYERYFNRSVLVDEFTPGYLGVVERIIGGVVYSNQGYASRNRPGINVEIFSRESGGNDIIAWGTVTYVRDDGCTIELTKTVRAPEEGDIVSLDFVEWTND